MPADVGLAESLCMGELGEPGLKIKKHSFLLFSLCNRRVCF